MTGIALVYHVGDKATLHSDLKRRFINLEARLVSIGSSGDEKSLDELTRERLSSEMNEPPVLRILVTLCHNELLRSMGYGREKQIEVGFLQRVFAPFFNFREHSITEN